ncbi:MAG: pyruvate carboxylase subunit B [Pseudomonadota bacterium]
MNPNPVQITDTTFRDGHQSLLATRMRVEDMLGLIKKMDVLGLHSLEVWGGATFDVCTRFLGEDPWERLERIRDAAPNTKLMMLLRGQNIVGYRNYADDVVEAFVKHSADTGIDIFRVFDALNDPRNIETAVKAIKASGKHFQAALSYSLTERRLGGPVFNVEYFVDKATTFRDMGADSICLKDMAGLIHPEDAYTLVKALKEVVDLPVQLHTHYTSGMASMAYLKAVEAGVDVLDCSLSPFAMRTGQPGIEPMVAALYGTARDPKLDLDALIGISSELEKIAPLYRDFLAQNCMAVIDVGVLKHQIPGGMLSNLVNQLKEADALDRIDEVYAELPRVRKDLGTCPLVTPTSQIVGIQAVQNVLFGRYEMITAQVKDYAFGLYGRPPRPMNPELRAKALSKYHRGTQPIDCRPGDILPPELEDAKKDIGDLARTDRDLLTYALYPTTGRRFLEWKYGLKPMPADVKTGKTLARLAREDRLIDAVRKGTFSGEPHMDMGASHTMQVSVGDEHYEIQVAQVGDRSVGGFAMAAAPMAAPVAGGASAPTSPAVASLTGTPVKAPMPGVVIRYDVAEGDTVTKGQKLMALEAMKMENTLSSPTDGEVLKLHHAAGQNVAKDEVLITIGVA